MKYVTGKIGYERTMPSAVSLGKFDGLHRGHQKLLEQVLQQKTKGLSPVIFTFTQNPTRVLTGLSAQNIMTNEERCAMLEAKGIDCLIECPFVPELMHMEAERFVEEILVRKLKAAFVAVGTDFRFGHQRRGDAALLQQLGVRYGFETKVVEKETKQGQEISSTWIREALHEGKIPLVNELLGYPYFVTGEVLHGRKIGRTLGLPTTNLLPPSEKLLPPNGVYLTRSMQLDGEDWEYYGITNVGYKPTVGAEEQKGVETYLFDYSGDLYGKRLKVEFLEYSRPEQKFESLEALKSRILSDVNWGKNRMRIYQ